MEALSTSTSSFLRLRQPAPSRTTTSIVEIVDVVVLVAGDRSVAEERAPDSQPLQLKIEHEAIDTSQQNIQTIQKYDWADNEENVKYVQGWPSVHDNLTKPHAM